MTSKVALTSVVSLDGHQWLPATDSQNVGRDRAWFKEPQLDAKPTHVPWTIQSVFPGYSGVAWYWRDLSAPLSPHNDGRFRLRFWDVDCVADVWVNGRHMGNHEGSQTRFTFDVASAVVPGRSNPMWDVISAEPLWTEGRPVIASQSGKAPSVPTAGLVGWWKLDTATGTSVPDSSGNGVNGVRVEAPTYKAGRVGEALHFDNSFLTNVHVRVDNVTKVRDALRSGYATFSCWAYPDRVPDQDPTNTGEGLVFTGYRGLSWNMSQRFLMGYYAGTGDNRWAKSRVHTPGRWYHVAGVVDTSKGTTRIYVNGRHEGTATFPVGATDDGGTTMLLGIGNPGYPSGTYGSYREAFKGKIDQIRIYNRALSDADIALLAAEAEPGRLPKARQADGRVRTPMALAASQGALR